MWDILKARSTLQDVITCLELILAGAPYVWCDFTDVPILDPDLDAVRARVLALEAQYPPGPSDYYLNPQGQEIVRCIVQDMKASLAGRMA